MTSGFLALRSVGFVAGCPLRATAVVNLPPVVDVTGMTGPGRQGLPARVTSVVAMRRRLLDELTERAKQSGAVGIVDVHFAETPFAVQRSGFGVIVEMTSTAVPVSLKRAGASEAWFRTALAPTDVAALLRAGWVPVDVLVDGAVLTRASHHRAADVRVAGSLSNCEIPGATDLIQRARRQIRDGFQRTAESLGGDGVLLHGDYATTWSSTMHLVEVSAVANVIAKWGNNTPPVGRSLPLSP